MICPSCCQDNYNPGSSFHWSGDFTKQCDTCGQDLPSNSCPSCQTVGYRKGMSFSYTEGIDCHICGKVLMKKMSPEIKIQTIKLPYPYKDAFSDLRFIEGWQQPGQLLIRFKSNNTKVLSVEDSLRTIHSLGLSPENIPGYTKPIPKQPKTNTQTQHITLHEWEQFQRWKESRNELMELTDDNLQKWKQLLDNLTNICPEFNEEIDEAIEVIRKLPRIMRYIILGKMPPMDLDDDDLIYYEENYMLNGGWGHKEYENLNRRRKTIVEIKIEEIGDGSL